VKQDRLLHIPSMYITPLRKVMNYLCSEAKKHIVMERDWSLIVRICVIITRVNADSQYKTYYFLELFLFEKKVTPELHTNKLYRVAKLRTFKPPVDAASRIYTSSYLHLFETRPTTHIAAKCYKNLL